MKYILSLIFIVALSGVALSDCIEGSGEVIENKVYLPEISKIEVNVPMILILTPDQNESILVKSNVDVLRNLKLDYNDKKLTISARNELCPKYLTIYISLETLNSLKLNAKTQLTGTAKFVAEDFKLDIDSPSEVDLSVDAEDVTINLDGEGKVMFSGKSETLNVELDGNGVIDASNHQTEEVDADLDGNGLIKINPSESLNATLDGTGQILYKSRPKKLKIDKDGTGIIDKIK